MEVRGKEEEERYVMLVHENESSHPRLVNARPRRRNQEEKETKAESIESELEAEDGVDTPSPMLKTEGKKEKRGNMISPP